MSKTNPAVYTLSYKYNVKQTRRQVIMFHQILSNNTLSQVLVEVKLSCLGLYQLQ